MICYLCKKKNTFLIWNDKLRSGKNTWTKNKNKIYQCDNCDLVFLEKRRKSLQDNKIFRKLFDGSNSISKYNSFNKPREKLKLDKIKKYLSFKNKKILESNCGAATNLDNLKKNSKITAGFDSEIYREHVNKKHLFYSSYRELKKDKIKFDIILSLGEIEHKYDVLSFVKLLKSKLENKGFLIFRIPNFNNIYKFLLDKDFLKYDYRLSHNFYFTEKSADFLFKKLKLKIFLKTGLQEYDFNHLIKYFKTRKRVKSYDKIFGERLINMTNDNLEKYKVSTSLLYILQK
ncbi:methyltransferase domain-containing protein [Candidatus Pelagibacter communis]|uniref:methyltransferase domain-containing protein n=1 Tax=Candidatus Pelagibacter TaxID=198251 RepID=UPI003EDF4283